jgi:hypothetical protein
MNTLQNRIDTFVQAVKNGECDGIKMRNAYGSAVSEDEGYVRDFYPSFSNSINYDLLRFYFENVVNNFFPSAEFEVEIDGLEGIEILRKVKLVK